MARPTTAARRYAEACFEIARRDKTQDRWRDDLHNAAALLGDPGVARVIDNPARPSAERSGVIDELLGGRVSDEARNLVRLLAQRGRLDALGAIEAEYMRLLNRERGVVKALVTSATKLTGNEVAALDKRLRKMTGAEVELDLRVDEGLIGGLTVRVGDRLHDASVRGRLVRLREQLLAGAR